uniref:J domain-containing protein n=1 Tax=Mesocestoides corti TaxID=53468 RepID=A0A5K3FEZ8_MESCO
MCTILLLLLCSFYLADAQVEGIYCGKQTCFDVLGISRDADVSAVQRAYRALAKEHHPDRQKTPQDKVQAKKTFHLIATAYGILRDPEQRQEYEYMLDNPSEMYYHYYRYFRRRYSPKVDVRVVIVATVLILSAIQVSLEARKQSFSTSVRRPNTIRPSPTWSATRNTATRQGNLRLPRTAFELASRKSDADSPETS